MNAVAPLVLSAFDLYRRRREALDTDRARAAELMQLPESAQKRLQELERADVEQAKLISDLSNNVEALATTLEREIEEGRRRETKLRRLLYVSLGVAAVAVALAARAVMA